MYDIHLADVCVNDDPCFGVDLDDVDVEVVFGQRRVPQPCPDLDGGANLRRKFVNLTPEMLVFVSSIDKVSSNGRIVTFMHDNRESLEKHL